MSATPAQPALRPQRELLIAWTLLLLDDREVHGYALHRSLLAARNDVRGTSVYRLLAKLERDRLVASRWSRSVDGPPRHVYRLTEEGRAALHDMAGAMAATRDVYGAFVDAHADAVARRSGDAVDEAAGPVGREAPTPEPVAGAAAPPAQRSMRPHKELLVGWLLLLLDGGATYGYDLRRAFHALRLSPDPAGMYRMLRRLEADKWVQSRWMSSAGGPRRRFYRLTGRGRRNLDEIAVLIAAIRDAHEDYLRAYARGTSSGDRPTDEPRCGVRS